MATQKQINEAIQNGAAWLKAKQNKNGSYGKWGLGSTGLAVMALLQSNIPNSDPAVENSISYILNSTPLESTYFRSLTVMALIANGKKTPAILNRLQSDTKWLIEAQGNRPENMLSYGGWGFSKRTELADGSNTQYAILALYSAHSWGLTVPQETWNRAFKWYTGNHKLNNNGSYVYTFSNIRAFNNNGVLYSMTSAALSSIKIINLLIEDSDIKNQAQKLIYEVLNWLNTNYTVDLDPGIPDSWYYYYLYSLKQGCVIEPHFKYIGTNAWILLKV